MKALVTGATGFIGSTLVEQLLGAGWQVRALVRNPDAARKVLPDTVEFARGDLSAEGPLEQAAQGVDVVFHLAGAIAASTPEGYFETNTHGTLRLARAALKNSGLKRFVYASSVAATGPSQGMQARGEDDAPAPVSSYGKSKLAAETELRKLSGLALTIVRPPVVYGPRDQGLLVVVKTVSHHFAPLLPTKTPSREKFYSSIQVQDLCRGLILAATKPEALGQAFYLTGDDVLTSTQLVDVIAKSLETSALRVRIPRWFLATAAVAMGFVGKFSKRPPIFNRDKLSEILPDYWIVSNAKAKRLLGFQPNRTFDEGMAEAVAWYRANSWV